jgi:NodT family efflux transporter outer membrane factor (OMF) lipoprotein
METIKNSCLKKPRRRLTLLLAFSFGLASGCAQIPRLDPPPAIRKIDDLGSSNSFAAPVAAWPGDQWWRAYGDPQLDVLIEEALHNAPDLDLARARLRAATAQVQGTGATRRPEVTASAEIAEAKQSYDFLVPRQALPQGWNGYGAATLNMSYELDFWGKNRAALAAAVSEQRAAEVEVAQTRLILSTSVASAYAGLLHLYTLRDNAADTLGLRMQTVALFRQRHQFGLETLLSVRQVEARQAAAKGDLLVIDERIGLQRNAIAALLGAGPDRGLEITRPKVAWAGSQGLPSNLSLDLLGRRPDIVAARLRTEAAAHRIDQRKAGFYPSVNLLAFAGFQSVGIDNLFKSTSQSGAAGGAISLPIFNTDRLQGQFKGARAEYDAAVATYNGTLSTALREVADAATSRMSLDQELAAARAAVAAAAEAHQLVSSRYEGALATYLDVLSAEDSLISARRSEAELETRALILDVSLVRALGGGFTPDSSSAPTHNPQT